MIRSHPRCPPRPPPARQAFGSDYKGSMRRAVIIVLAASAACAGNRGGGSNVPVRPEQSSAADPGDHCLEQAAIKLSPAPDAPERIDVAHVLVRYGGVRGAEGVTRTRQQACLRALDARKRLLAGGEWDAVHKEFSDSQGATRGGLFDVRQDDLDSAFSGAAFSLKVDELSHVVETPRGFHLIWRKK